jgi:hypothetical protein
VEAKANGATGTEMMGILLLDLMKQRFHLQTHTEPKGNSSGRLRQAIEKSL